MGNIFERIEEKSKEGSIEITLAKSLEKLIQMLDDSTEYTLNELKSISIIMNDKYLKESLSYLESNRKHKNRKRVNEVLEALKHIASCIASNSSNAQNLSIIGGGK